MREGFWSGMTGYLQAWAGLVFTVAGTVYGLFIGGEYAWIGALVAVSGLLAAYSYAYRQRQLLIEAEHRHLNDAAKLNDAVTLARQQAGDAERKLQAIPADILMGLDAVIRQHSFADAARLLGKYAAYIERIRQCKNQIEGRPIRLRTFIRRDGLLYAVAGLKAEALGFLRQDDPFLLEFKDPNGLVTKSAHLFVHQKDDSKELVWFHVKHFLGDEMTSIDALAEIQEVGGKGYTVRYLVDLDRYSRFTGLDIAELIDCMARELGEIGTKP